MKLAKSRLHTQRRLLDQKLALLKASEKIPPPPSGWIQAIRESMGMTTRQMGKYLGMSGAAVTKLENRERAKGITLKDLQRVAEILDCRLMYALVPVETLESTLRTQAAKTAARLSEKADHAMKLEDQQVNPTELRAQRDVLAKLLLESLDSRIWAGDEKWGRKK